MERLSAHTLAALESSGAPRQVVLPPKGWQGQDIGIIHLGIGAFHRAHQAVFTQDTFAATGDDRWGISGVTQRSAGVKKQLAPQDGLYGVLERDVDSTGVTVVGSVREVLFPADEHEALMQRFAAPASKVVTLTVTEKGYHRNADGGLDLDDPAVRADLDAAVPTTAIGRLVAGLRARADAGSGPITLVCCDNLPSNGEVLERLVRDFCGAIGGGDQLAAWLDTSVSFPSTMVDRIVPATTDADREMGEKLLGLHDEGLVTGELFKQWVIEDRFVADRPAWERAGAQLTSDVAPFEAMKLRTLNGTHSTLAYLGALRGYRTISESIADAELRQTAEDLITDDVLPTLQQPEGEDLQAYGQSVLHRFSNPALAHRTTQIAMDGSQKLPQRLLGTIRDNLAAGRTPHNALLGVAGWMAYLASPQGRGGLDLPIDDPLADRLSQVRGTTDAGAVVGNLLEVRDIFGDDLPHDESVRSELVARVGDLLRSAN